MAGQIIKQPSIFGRLGSGIGKGLGEQIPKEIDRSRLASGLQQLEQEGANLTPQQYYTRALQIPGLVDRPQVVQSLGQLAQQQTRGQALINQSKKAPPSPSPFPQKPQQQNIPGQDIPSITQEQPLGQIQEGYIPPTQDQIYDDAGKRYNENPALFNFDPNKAIEAAEKAAIQNESINKAYQKKHENLNTIQDNVVDRLKTHSKGMGVAIPSNIYSKIEDKAIQATKPKSQGGDGLTEQQAMKKYGDELDSISRDYSNLEGIGNWGIVARPAKNTLGSINSLQSKFESRNDTENMADKLIGQSGLSPKLAFGIAQKVSREPQLQQQIKNLPRIKPKVLVGGGLIGGSMGKATESKNKTMEIAPQIASKLGKKGSPLAAAYELEKLGYDPLAWLEYLDNHRKDLNLSEEQGRQLDRPRNWAGNMNDWWLSSFSDL